MSWDFSHNGENQRFGWRPRNGGEWHYGRDYGTKGKDDVPLGVPRYCDGWICHVVENNKMDGHGNQVLLFSPDGSEMVRFSHIETGTMRHLKNGQILRTGDWLGNIAGVGNAEHSYQPHIHVEHGRNPRYNLIQIEHNNRLYRYRRWCCGDHKIGNYIDPNKGALPFSELESLTDMAYQSRQAVLGGYAPKRKTSRFSPQELVKIRPQQGFPFWDWFKSTWLGRLFFPSEETKTPTRTGPTIHRTSLAASDENKNTTPVRRVQNENSSALSARLRASSNANTRTRSERRVAKNQGANRVLNTSAQNVYRDQIEFLTAKKAELDQLLNRYKNQK